MKHDRAIDLNGPTTNARVEWFPVGDWASVEVVGHAPWSTAVVELVRSLGMGAPVLFVPTVELTPASPSVFDLATRGVGHLGVRLRTAEGSALSAIITVLTE